MIKKFMLAIIILVVTLSAGFMIFADVDAIEEEIVILNPEVGTSGKAIVNDSMFISVYVETERDLVLELIKKPVFIFDEYAALRPHYEMGLIEEKISMFDISSIREAFTKEEIFYEYQQAKVDLALTQETYDANRTEMNDLKSQLSLSVVDQLKLNAFEENSKTYNQAQFDFNKWEKKYLALFEVVIVDDIKMNVSTAFPYFEHTVERLTPGNYQLNIKTSHGVIVESMIFDVVTEQSITDEILEQSHVFEDIISDGMFD